MPGLELLPGAPNEIVVQRVFDAPRRLVVKAMTEPELIKRWLGGVRAIVVSAEVDARVGGRYRYVFRRPDGVEFAFNGSFRELTDERVVQSESFEGKPGESLVTTTFTESGGKTTLHIVIAFESEMVRDIVVRTGMTTGMGESYDKLQELLAAL
jgi:uncharacterized protein YndB with AHSA1/START domain